MVFSSITFLFAFLPLCLALYYVTPAGLRNTVLLLMSLLFYAWSEGPFIAVMVASIVLNWASGCWVRGAESSRGRIWVLAPAVLGNLVLLGSFKYANLFVDSLNGLLRLASVNDQLFLGPVHLPIGISFFTFHGLSYVIDIYRNKETAERNPLRVALYISMFPQLVAGPIVRYADIAQQLRARQTTLAGFVSGIERFIVGLGKKVLLANSLAVAADQAFGTKTEQLSALHAWAGIAAYMMQIYFDFSGYSDMAIGLARMFGLNFRENFQYPYVSRSITEFWRRWHISLSTWFRDYLYIPLGGNRHGKRRTFLNLWTVFLLCGLWHGAAWNFVVWGALHGTLLAIERVGLLKLFGSVQGARRWVAHVYTLFMLAVTWVFFRADTLANAMVYLKAMFGFNGHVADMGLDFMNSKTEFALTAGALGCTPLVPLIARYFATWRGTRVATAVGLLAMFWLAAASLAAGSHNPFIYFRF